MAAPPVEVELAAPDELEELESDDFVEVEVVSVEVSVEVVPVVAAVPVDLTEETKVLLPLPVAGVTTGEVRPAGMEAAGSWEVTTAG